MKTEKRMALFAMVIIGNILLIIMLAMGIPLAILYAFDFNLQKLTEASTMLMLAINIVLPIVFRKHSEKKLESECSHNKTQGILQSFSVKSIIISPTVTTILFYIIDVVVATKPNKFLIIALPTVFTVSLCIALFTNVIMGFFFYLKRKINWNSCSRSVIK